MCRSKNLEIAEHSLDPYATESPRCPGVHACLAHLHPAARRSPTRLGSRLDRVRSQSRHRAVLCRREGHRSLSAMEVFAGGIRSMMGDLLERPRTFKRVLPAHRGAVRVHLHQQHPRHLPRIPARRPTTSTPMSVWRITSRSWSSSTWGSLEMRAHFIGHLMGPGVVAGLVHAARSKSSACASAPSRSPSG